MVHHSITYAPTQLAQEMEGVTWKIMMQLATMMVMIAALMLIELEMVNVMKKIKTKSATLIVWIAAKTGNQLEIGFAMLRTIINTVGLIGMIVVIIPILEMVFVMILTIIHGVCMMRVIAVWMSQSQTSALIADAMKMAYQSAM